jgi:hypothetical protein
MAAESPVSPGTQPAQAGWRAWLKVVACAFLLLALSEALWVWQTWPVRELLQTAPGSPRPAGTP